MASYYVWSGATGSANGTSWANAYTTLTAALSGKVAGDLFYVAHDHAESTAGTVTLTTAGTPTNPTKVACANRAGSVPPVSADARATATVTASGGAFVLFVGSTHYDGIIFTAGVGATTGSEIYCPNTGTGVCLRFDNCSLRLASTGSLNRIYIGNGGGCPGTYVEFNNTTVSFANASSTIDLAGMLKWRNTPSALLGTIPTTLFGVNTGARGALVECIGVDLSAMGAGKTIIVTGNNSICHTLKFVDCKINAAVTKFDGTSISYGSHEVDYVRTAATGNYAVARYRICGALTEETTIVRTGGATDGTTPIAWKIITTAICTYSLPFECPPIALWNDTTGSAKTATIEGVWGGGAVPLDSEIWLDLQYLGASTPPASFINDGRANLFATAANQTTSSATWGGSTTKFKLDVTFTAQQKGWIYARVKCAKASSTFYIDPLITLT